MSQSGQISVAVPSELVADLESRFRHVVREEIERSSAFRSRWLDVAGAAEYASMTVEAIRSAEKRGQIQSHRSTTGRIRFRTEDLDAFLRGEAGDPRFNR